jgi:hypothetical protein
MPARPGERPCMTLFPAEVSQLPSELLVLGGMADGVPVSIIAAEYGITVAGLDYEKSDWWGPWNVRCALTGNRSSC